MASRCQASRRQVPCERGCSLQCEQAVFPAVGLAHRVHGEALKPPLVRPGMARRFSGRNELCRTSLLRKAPYVMSPSLCHVCPAAVMQAAPVAPRSQQYSAYVLAIGPLFAGGLMLAVNAPDSCFRSRCTRPEGTRTMWRPPGWSLARKLTRQLSQPQPKRRLPSSQASMQPRSARRSATALAWA